MAGQILKEAIKQRKIMKTIKKKNHVTKNVKKKRTKYKNVSLEVLFNHFIEENVVRSTLHMTYGILFVVMDDS